MAQDNILGVPVVTSYEKCEECGKPGPNHQWSVPGLDMSGVLCRVCLNKVLGEINRALEATSDEGRSK